MLEIQRKISNYNYSSRNGQSIEYIVLHYTGNSSDLALSNVNYFYDADRSASAHLFVDETSIWQSVELENSAWAVGGGTVLTASNRNSISIEMCCSGNYEISETTENNAIELVRYLMDTYNIDINHVVRHYDCNTIHKVCPNWEDNSWARWYDFKEKLQNGSTTFNGEWILQDSKWWYKHSDGSYTKDGWEKIGGAWYLFDSEGYMIYDWKKSGGSWYYLSDSNYDGKMKIGWIFDKNDSKWYYCNSNGAMLTGWQNIDSNWYYLDVSGVMQTGWINDGGKFYCCYSNGVMIHDTNLYNYHFDSNGVATKL